MSSSADRRAIRVVLTLALATGMTLTVGLPAAACDGQGSSVHETVTGSIDCDPAAVDEEDGPPTPSPVGDVPECTEERRDDPTL